MRFQRQALLPQHAEHPRGGARTQRRRRHRRRAIPSLQCPNSSADTYKMELARRQTSEKGSYRQSQGERSCPRRTTERRGWLSTCNALNLGVEFFLLFSHQIRALLSFLFPRFAHSSCRSTFLGLMLSVRLVPFRISICDLIPFSGPRTSWVFDPRSGLAQPSPARPGPARPCVPLAPNPPPRMRPPLLPLSFGSPAQQPLLSLFHLSLPVVP
jgi:hypothetical protein